METEVILIDNSKDDNPPIPVTIWADENNIHLRYIPGLPRGWTMLIPRSAVLAAIESEEHG